MVIEPYTVMFTRNLLKMIEVVQIIEKNCIDAFVLKDCGPFFTSDKNRDGVLLMDVSLEKR